MQRIPLVGYADRFSAAPGESVAFKVSSTSAAPYTARLVRVVSCDPNPDGPGVIEHEVAAGFAGEYPSRDQPVHLGSYMIAKAGSVAAELTSFTFAANVWPTLTGKGLQVVMALGPGPAGAALAIDGEGVMMRLGTTEVRTHCPLVERRWYRIWGSYDAASGVLSVAQVPLRARFDAEDSAVATLAVAPPPAPPQGQSWSIAAELADAAVGPPARHHFNGKVERPLVAGTVLDAAAVAGALAGRATPSIVACWDFSTRMDSPLVDDLGPDGHHGTLVNLPTRAVMGTAWDGRVFDWTSAPAQYGAVYFHDDDLYDCEWETDFEFTVPDDLASGVYAARLAGADGASDMIPFFVTAPPGRPRSRICVLIPTFTYTVYANIARGNTNEALRARARDWQASPWNTDDHPEYGLSTYNYHSDGTGITYSSRRRPIITMRSAVLCYPDVPGSALRHFAADAHLWHWLEHQGYDFDVITDDELHTRGADAVAGYDVLMTTTHPEYHTRETLDALEGYSRNGGRFAYLGGNGFYWKVARSDGWPDAIEVRRGEGGIRAWAAEPGEYYNAFDGSYGGLWRRNGRPPQMLCGVGFTSQGGHLGDAYRRTPASYDPEHAWMFEGIEGEVIGDFGLSGGGAAGFELDRADRRLGTPHNAVVVASSEGHGDHFVLVPEDILTNVATWNGETPAELIRADIVYFETGPGARGRTGAVFSVGSITFCGSLPVNDCDNNVSRLLGNVLDRFLA